MQMRSGGKVQGLIRVDDEPVVPRRRSDRFLRRISYSLSYH